MVRYQINRQILYIIKIIEQMSCCDCRCKPEQIRVRCTPTYYHHPIFQDFGQANCGKICQNKFRQSSNRFQNERTQSSNKNICSTMQNTLGRGNKEGEINIDEKKQYCDRYDTAEQKIRPSSAAKYPKLQKEISFNPNSSTKFQNAGNYNPVSNHTLLWFDPEKSVLLRQSSACHHHGYSKQRKLLQLSSCPFYPVDGGVHREFAKCRLCSKLSNCPLCGGFLFCERCKLDCNGKGGCCCGKSGYENEICTCGPCKKCGHPNTYQQSNSKQAVKQQVKVRLSNCANCLDSCPCGKVCFCSDQCTCCQNKERARQIKKSNNCPACVNNCSCGPSCVCGPSCKCCSSLRNGEQSCGCGKGKCSCDDECACGINCRCCPKFLPYGTCKCDEKCRCGPSCKCQSECTCCPKFQVKPCPKNYKQPNLQRTTCNCGPECGCGPGCRCGPLCKCEEKKSKYYANQDNRPANKNTKTGTTIANGTKKTKMGQQAIRKSQPVFRSVTRQRI